MQENVRVRIIVSGRVQGVFFRKHAQDKAKELRLTGWAHNTIDGKVEIVVEGKKEKTDEFLEWCRQGSSLAKVDDIEVEHEDPKGEFDDFEVREFGF